MVEMMPTEPKSEHIILRSNTLDSADKPFHAVYFGISFFRYSFSLNDFVGTKMVHKIVVKYTLSIHLRLPKFLFRAYFKGNC